MLDTNAIYNKLKPQLTTLDAKRKFYYLRVKPFQYILWALMLGAVFLVFRWNMDALKDYLFPDEEKTIVVMWYSFVLPIWILVFILVHNYNLKKFKKLFTDQIAPVLVSNLGSGFTYQYNGLHQNEYFKDSLILPDFTKAVEQDFITGTLDGKEISFSELSLIRVSTIGKKQRTTPVFNGIFFEAHLSVSFPTGIWLIPVSKFASPPNLGKEKLSIEHPGLERYHYYVDDQQKGEAVLQPAILDKIVALDKKLDDLRITTRSQRISYHFEGSVFQAAIPTFGAFLEPRLSRSLLDRTFIEEQVTLINAMWSMLSELTL